MHPSHTCKNNKGAVFLLSALGVFCSSVANTVQHTCYLLLRKYGTLMRYAHKFKARVAL